MMEFDAVEDEDGKGTASLESTFAFQLAPAAAKIVCSRSVAVAGFDVAERTFVEAYVQ